MEATSKNMTLNSKQVENSNWSDDEEKIDWASWAWENFINSMRKDLDNNKSNVIS